MNVDEYLKIFLDINEKYRLMNYPSEVDTINFNNQEVYLKRDDLLDLKCSKQRSMTLLVDYYLKRGDGKFCIASTGNAALVAAFIANKDERIKDLKVFLSDISIVQEKIEKFIKFLKLPTTPDKFRKGFKYKNVEFIFSPNPKQRAFGLIKEGYVNLRGSTDDIAIEGFKSIAYELASQIQDIDAVFIPASSGTTVKGISEGFLDLGLNPQIHVVQTSKVSTLVKRIAPSVELEPDHPASSIMDVVGHRRLDIEQIIKKSRGNGWIINKAETLIAYGELRKMGILTSADSALTFAAFKRTNFIHKFKKPVLIFTG
jgi:threonine dehydratase